MHPSMQQRVAGLNALRQRTQIATADLYAMIGKEQPVQQIRYQVKTAGKAFHIVERATDKVRGFRWTWVEAINFAQQLEARADAEQKRLGGLQ